MEGLPYRSSYGRYSYTPKHCNESRRCNNNCNNTCTKRSCLYSVQCTRVQYHLYTIPVVKCTGSDDYEDDDDSI